MSEHECRYAEMIRQKPEWQTDSNGVETCVFCHVPRVQEKPVPKTVRKA